MNCKNKVRRRDRQKCSYSLSVTLLLKSKLSELSEIRRVFEGLHTLYEIHLPKVHPKLIHDLMMRRRNNPGKDPFYLIEVFTKPEINSEEMRTYIIRKTGMNPTIHDSGTHYAFNNKLTLEFLKELSDSKDVIAVYGDYMGAVTGVGASHDHREHEHGWIKEE